MATRDAQQRILNAATDLWSEHGFEVPLAKIARRARVTPAQLRRHFPTRKTLADRVMADLFAGRWKPEWDALLADRAIPLETRIVRFYTEYRSRTTRTGSRLWTRAGLMGLHASGNFSATLAKRILDPVVRALRHEAGLPDGAPVTGAERELAQMLHGAIAFPNSRRFIYGMDVHGELPELIAMIVRVWLPGARAEIRALNRK